MDQILHIAILLTIAIICANGGGIATNSFGLSILRNTGVQVLILPKVICSFLLILKPANVIIKRINPKFCPESNDTENKGPSAENREYANAGGKIGNLERMLILVMLMLKQYTVIAFILAAKSLTRYDRIVKEPYFAEYYLIGTLSSLLIAVLASLIACY